MGSRYALRETEGAIGLDCRRLADGRAAVFRHTSIHKRTRRDFLERRDVISAVISSMMCSASIASHNRIDVRHAFDAVNEFRDKLIGITFPYISMDGSSKGRDKADYDAYFDELDRIEEEERKTAEGKTAKGESKDPGDGAEASEMV